MEVVILSFADENDDCTEFEAVVDTLNPILAIIDADDEPDVPFFPGCTLLDTSYGSSGNQNEFIIDYALDDDSAVVAQTAESVLRGFLQATYGITVQSFKPMEQEPPTSGLTSHRPCP